jgi:predicted aconitase
MYLTKEEERIYEGECGWAYQICMKILVRLGELFDATRLISISSAHVSGVSYKTLGDAPVEFLEALSAAGGKANVRATLNPQGFDMDYLSQRLDADLCRKQLNVLKQFERMGFAQSLTCTPYYLEEPSQDSHLAWAESSAVVYTNSVLGAWTNREGGPSALAAAIIRKTPDYGMHKVENRQPKVSIMLEAQLQNEMEFGALGNCLGKILEDKIPIIHGLKDFSREDLKQLGAALASAGMVNMFHPNSASVKTDKLEKITIENEDIRRSIESLSTASKSKPDLIFIGCPHCSLTEIKKVACIMDSRKIKSGKELWICTSRFIKEKARNYVQKIEQSGAHVITDTCAVVTWTENLGIKTIMTNSAKTAYYAPALNKAETVLAPLKECLNTALEG